MSTTATETAIVTRLELEELADWEKKYAKAKKDQANAEKQLGFRRQALAEKVLGIKSADELKQMPPHLVERRFTSRLDSGAWKPERGAPEFSFRKTNEGRYPSWSKLYAAELGETAASRVNADTPLTFSYAVEVQLL